MKLLVKYRILEHPLPQARWTLECHIRDEEQEGLHSIILNIEQRKVC